MDERIVHAEVAAEYRGIAAQAADPIPMTHDHGRSLPAAVLVFEEGSAENWVHTQSSEKVRAYVLNANLFGNSAVGESHRAWTAESNDRSKYGLLCRKFTIDGFRNSRELLSASFQCPNTTAVSADKCRSAVNAPFEHHKLVRIRHRQWFEQRSIDKRKDCAVRA